MSTIGRRIDTAVQNLIDIDYENALIQVSIAIDSTAKRKWSGDKPGKRITKFVKEYEAFVYQFGSGGGIVLEGSGDQRGKLVFSGMELPELFYKAIRCAALHGDELHDRVEIVEGNNRIGLGKGKIVLNKGFIDGFLFSVVSDKVNSKESCDSNPTFTIHGNAIKINDIWGRMDLIETLTGYRKIF